MKIMILREKKNNDVKKYILKVEICLWIRPKYLKPIQNLFSALHIRLEQLILNVILNNWCVFKDDPKLNGTFNTVSVIAYKRASNIKDRTVKACPTKQSSQNNSGSNLFGNFKCVNHQFTKKGLGLH